MKKVSKSAKKKHTNFLDSSLKSTYLLKQQLQSPQIENYQQAYSSRKLRVINKKKPSIDKIIAKNPLS